MQGITPFLWFDSNAEEAVAFYTSTFKNSRTVSVARYSEEGAKASGRPANSVMTIAFELNGQPFTALNGGPVFKFSQAISFVANCDTQQEIDHLWEKLSAGGQIPAMRLADRPVRNRLADHPRRPPEAHDGPEGGQRHEGAASDEEARHPRAGRGGALNAGVESRKSKGESGLSCP
jgi:predicted 3-demethylubiquinone-9 3-methyltransferase (glyoxalase superfamily)